ncbi:accessory Sec system S-layer assembly protein [Brevibacillus ginsengisoli]|uniref:accessory Sec system S-layer assembly protein n=1 Tax=Brevibacillus ginsengisoli TaxID=363854 RepID=UPI003CED8D9A
MLSFMKNWLKKDQGSLKQEDTELIGDIREESVLSFTKGEEKEQEQSQSEPISKEQKETGLNDTPLSLHSSWEMELDAGQKYALSFMLSELPPMASGNVSLAGMKIFPHEDGVEIMAFVRNGLPRPIRLGEMPLVILIQGDELFARQTFDLSELDEIPAHHARPWSFVFKRENFLQKDVMLVNWKLAFELAQKKLVLPQQLELEESWIKALSDEQKASLIELAKNLPGLQPGEVNIQSIQISRAEDQSLRAMLLIRNGSDQALSFEKLPLMLYDATNEKVAEGLFELEGLTVNPGTSKPWLFIYPEASIVKENPDLSRWRVSVPQI